MGYWNILRDGEQKLAVAQPQGTAAQPQVIEHMANSSVSGEISPV